MAAGQKGPVFRVAGEELIGPLARENDIQVGFRFPGHLKGGDGREVSQGFAEAPDDLRKKCAGFLLGVQDVMSAAETGRYLFGKGELVEAPVAKPDGERIERAVEDLSHGGDHEA
jgi:hypothetical protein